MVVNTMELHAYTYIRFDKNRLTTYHHINPSKLPPFYHEQQPETHRNPNLPQSFDKGLGSVGVKKGLETLHIRV